MTLPASTCAWRWTATSLGRHLTRRRAPQRGDLVTTACGRVTHVVTSRGGGPACGDCERAREVRGR